mgnify:CR=1 FL=1
MYIEFNDKEIIERIKLRIKDLKNMATIKSQADIARKMGFSAQQFSEILAGRNKLTPVFIIKFCVNTSTSYDYIVKGIYPVYDDEKNILLEQIILNEHQNTKGKEESKTKDNTVTYNTLQYPVKPFIDSVYAVCGSPSGFSLAIKETECEGLSLPFMNEYDFSIKAKGDSMINRNNPARSIREGDIVACRLWKSRSHVRWGEVYALATSEGVVIKKLQESDRNGFIKCVSFNIEDGFNPYDLPVEEIFDWAIVTGVVSARNWN